VRYLVILTLTWTLLNEASAETLRDKIEDIRRAHGIAAAAYFVVGPTSIDSLEAFGQIDWGSDVKFKVEHLIRIGSITKAFSALATTILVERGSLNLETPASTVLEPPPYQNQWAANHPVTIEQLLEHTAGLKNLSNREFEFNRPLTIANAFKLDPRSRVLAWPPGRHSSYSNSGAGIVSAIIATVTGRDYTDFVRAEIFARLGMPSARFSFRDAQRDGLITGYDSDGRTAIDYWHTLYPAFGGISVTTRDMIPFVQLFLNRGRLGEDSFIKMSSIERMQQPATTLAARAGLGYGYGLGIYQYQRHGISFYGHGGDADGYLSFFAYSPRQNQGYFVVVNAFIKPALSKMRRVIEEYIIGTSAEPTYPENLPLNQKQISLLSGVYREVTQRFRGTTAPRTLKVFVEGKGLSSAIGAGKKRDLLAVTEWHFRRSHQTAATIAFIPCLDRVFLQGDFGNFEKRLPAGQFTDTCTGSSR